MKKWLLFLCVLFLSVGAAGTAMALTFDDTIDYWYQDLSGDYHFSENYFLLSNGTITIDEGEPLTYTHDINDHVDLDAIEITAASLELKFNKSGLLSDDLQEEYVTLDLPLYVNEVASYESSIDLGEIDPGVYSGWYIDVDWLNDDGLMDVTLTVRNEEAGWLSATEDVVLDYSRLTVFYEEISGTTPAVPGAPVPEPATMILLGTGLIGIAGFSKKRMQKA